MKIFLEQKTIKVEVIKSWKFPHYKCVYMCFQGLSDLKKKSETVKGH